MEKLDARIWVQVGRELRGGPGIGVDDGRGGSFENRVGDEEAELPGRTEDGDWAWHCGGLRGRWDGAGSIKGDNWKTEVDITVLKMVLREC